MNKARLKTLLYGLELRSTAIIANGLVHRVPKRVVMKQLRTELAVSNRRIGLNLVEISSLYASLENRYVIVSRKTFSGLRKSDKEYKEKLAERQDVVYSVVRSTVLERLERDKNILADVVEKRKKTAELGKLLSSGVFYLCSSHEKPAKDHEGYEGRVYISEDWENRCAEADRASIRAYVKRNGTRTVEWVTGAPVYMIFRPNCKHYFIPVSVEEVLGRSEKELLEAHKGYMKDEIPETYEKSQYKGYYERLKALTYLKKMCPSSELDKDITRTRKLVLKWGIRAKGRG